MASSPNEVIYSSCEMPLILGIDYSDQGMLALYKAIMDSPESGSCTFKFSNVDISSILNVKSL